jgi:sporulation protein YlmC with PRC-barrel domain
MIRKKHAILLLLLTIPLFLFAQEQAANQPMDRDGDNFSAISGLTRASQLLDYSIANREGDLSGSVRDIVIDANGSIAFFLVDMSGAQASGAQSSDSPAATGTGFYLIPADRVSRSDDRQSLVFDLTRDEFGELSPLAEGEISSGAADSGTLGVQPGVGIAVSRMLANNLIGSTMVTDQNAELGVVEDIVINLSERQVQYLALSAAGVLGIGEQYHAVPMQVFAGMDPVARQVIVQLRAENLVRDEGFSPQGLWPLQASAQLQSIGPRTEDNQTYFGFPGERATDDEKATPGNGASSPPPEPPDETTNRFFPGEDETGTSETPSPSQPDTRGNKFFDED